MAGPATSVPQHSQSAPELPEYFKLLLCQLLGASHPAAPTHGPWCTVCQVQGFQRSREMLINGLHKHAAPSVAAVISVVPRKHRDGLFVESNVRIKAIHIYVDSYIFSA